jgi:hypothetical protein
MRTRLRPRLTYGNVVATLALFIALGGGAVAAMTSFVQTKGTIRGCVSKKGQLTLLKKGKSRCARGQTKIAWSKGGATGPAGGDLAGNYPNPSIKPNAVTGAKVNESTLGEVPSATNSSLLGGLAPSAFLRSSNVVKIDATQIQSSDGTTTTNLPEISGFQLLMDCSYDSGSDSQTIKFRAQSVNAHAVIAWIFGTQGLSSVGTGDFPVMAPPGSTTLFSRATAGANSEFDGAAFLVYRDDTQTISISFRYDVHRSVHQCVVAGIATRAG